VETGAATVDHRCVKTNDHAVAAGHSVDPARWQEAFEGPMSQIAGRFTRVESRRRARKLVLGLLSDLPRKNCWTIAEWAGDKTPDGMQHLLGRAKWDADQVRDDVRAYKRSSSSGQATGYVVDEVNIHRRDATQSPSGEHAAGQSAPSPRSMAALFRTREYPNVPIR
jgi:hypothetical protein